METRFPSSLEKSSMKRIQGFWLKALNKTLQYAREASPFYRKQLKKISLPLQSLEQFSALPLTSKAMLQQANESFFALPRNQWQDLFATSGTTGEPLLFPQSLQDLERTKEAEVRALTISGVTPQDTVLLHMPLHGQLWGAGLSYYLGYQKIGACVLRTGPVNIDYQVALIKRLKPSVLHTNGNLALHLASKLSLKERSSFKLLIVGLNNLLQEDLSFNELGQEIKKAYPQAQLNPVYGITENAAPWHACPLSPAYHITPQFCVVEILDEKEKKVLPPGHYGILTLTPLYLEGLPLVRYLTNDIAALLPEPCPCGHRLLLSPLQGRLDQRIKIKGVTLYPQAIEAILKKDKTIQDYYLEVSRTSTGLDMFSIYVLSRKRKFFSLQEKIQKQLGIKPEIKKTDFSSFQKKVLSHFKPKRFFDLRPSS